MHHRLRVRQTCVGEFALITAIERGDVQWENGRGILLNQRPAHATSPSELQPRHPLDIAGTLKVPVLGLYGGADQGIPLTTVEQMRAALKAAGNPSEIIVYPDTPHAFNADYRAGYRKEAADDGWKRLQEWFGKYGVM